VNSGGYSYAAAPIRLGLLLVLANPMEKLQVIIITAVIIITTTTENSESLLCI